MVVQRAGFWARIVANLIDLLLIGVPLAVAAVTFFGIKLEVMMIVSLSLLLYVWVVPIYCSGYTLGKHIVGIRIYACHGGSVTYAHMSMRIILSGLIYFGTCGLALVVTVFMIVFRKDKQAIHDLLSKTFVAFVQK